MSTDVYKRLRSHFHQHPMGFPKTKSEMELRILKRLFDEEEAYMALNLTPRPETAKSIAKRLGKDPEELSPLLERMADKGQILTLGEKDKRSYLLVPYIPGVWEYHLYPNTNAPSHRRGCDFR